MNSSSTSHSLLYLFLSLYQSSVFFSIFFDWNVCTFHIIYFYFISFLQKFFAFQICVKFLLLIFLQFILTSTAQAIIKQFSWHYRQLQRPCEQQVPTPLYVHCLLHIKIKDRIYILYVCIQMLEIILKEFPMTSRM